MSVFNYMNINKSKKIIFNRSKFLIELFTMPSDKNNVENLLHEYLLEKGIVKDRIDSAKSDFGFKISFPLGPKSQYLSICKPKSMNGIFITIRFQFSKKKAEILNSLKDNKKLHFFYSIII